MLSNNKTLICTQFDGFDKEAQECQNWWAHQMLHRAHV